MTDPTPVSTSTKPQANESSAGAPAAVLDPPEQPASAPPPSGVELWMHRISVFLFVLISAVAGVLLIILPWTPGVDRQLSPADIPQPAQHRF